MTKSCFEYVFFFVAIGAFPSSLSFRKDVLPSGAVPFDCRDPCFRNFDSIIFIDVIRMKSYVETKLGHAGC